MKIERTREFYEIEFEKKERSPQDIAEQFGTYPNKIRRELVLLGFTLRDKKRAQQIALKTGRHKHPTKGRKRPEDVKIRISEAMAKNWEDMGDEERQRRVTLGKQQWESMSEDERFLLQESALEAVRETSKEGSKLEKFLLTSLRENNYEVLFHSEHILPGTRLQTDLHLPGQNIVIEIDGPSHFYPIWGQENLEKNIEADNKKNSLLLTYGFVVLRIKHLVKTLSEIHKRRLLKEVLRIVKEIETKFPTLGNRLIEIELKG